MSFRVVLFKKEPAPSAGRTSRQHRGRMIAAMLARLAAPALVASLLLGCVLPDTSKPPSACQQLHAIDVGALPDPPLDEGQQARREEGCQYLLQEQQAAGWQVVFSSQTPLGQIWDWVDPTTVGGDDVQPPSAPTLAEIQAMLPEGVQLAHMEIEDHPELQAAGMIPYVRPDFSAYVAGGTGATSLGDWLDNYQVSGSPSNPDRLYAGVRSVVDNYGGNVFINPFGGFIESGTMACHELAVGCRVNGEMWQLIGVVAIRDGANLDRNYGHAVDSVLRLGVEFYSAGPDGKREMKGFDGVNSINKFQAPKENSGFRKYGPGAYFAPSTISTVGGTQYESFYQIKLEGGDWKVIHNGNFIGYYPTTLFDKAPPPNLVATKACEFDVYGEVYAPKPVPWTTTPMGSGHFAAEKSPNAAGFRDITYIADPAAPPVGPPPNVTVDAPGSNDACYTKTPLVLGPAPWNWFFYADGPGGAAPGCTGPLP